MNTRKYFLGAIALIIGTTGCDSSSEGTGVDQPGATSTEAALNLDLASVSKAAAAALADPATASWINDETMERFDGETNVLWNTLNAEAPAGKSALGALPWNTLLAQTGVFEFASAGKSASDLPAEIQAIVERASAAYGGLVHLYWPYAEEWDGETAPLVGFAPLGVDLDMLTQVDGFDASGETVTITEEMTRVRPVVFITYNERTDADGNVVLGDLSSLPVGKGGSQSMNNDANWPGYFKMVRAQFYDDHEGITQGGPDFWAYITKAESSSQFATQRISFEYMRPEFGTCQNNQAWCPIVNPYLFPWDKARNPSYHVQWIEKDGGRTDDQELLSASFSTPVPALPGFPPTASFTLGFKIFLDKRDDVLGSAVTSWDSPIKIYYTGDPNFETKYIPTTGA